MKKNEAPVVSVRGVKKRYKLYRSSLDRFKEALHPLRKRYAEDFVALQGIDLEVYRGQTWGIIGFNGSGKSTLLKIICGIIQPSAGVVRVSGRISALLELGSGFNPEYTGRENVFFAGVLAGFSRGEMEKRLSAIAEFADIGEFMDQPVKSYSSGMLMRLAFAVSVHVEPDILVIDEALAVGDARFQHRCMGKIKEFQGRSTILLVTHDLNAVLTFCDRVAWLDQGKLVGVGNPKTVVDRYTQAFYEGVPEAINDTTPHSPVLSDDICPLKDEAVSFGSGEVKITDFKLLSSERGAVEAVYGGENVELDIWLAADTVITDPIVGFMVKNRLGVEIFGFNNLHLEIKFPALKEGREYLVKFRFAWPRIAPDNYSLSIAVAAGSMEKHSMFHWINNILVVEVLNQGASPGGLVMAENPAMEMIHLAVENPT